ncbi:MAG TPA: 23S rRNA (guanosine(2251)-2'-O)-methyltransferase RlmB [Actinomycetota bacterium]|nr:23S rRNA (guanosine(2251)-2'-O)-methyltransferase RlmB [Actinomycetota bacterium]
MTRRRQGGAGSKARRDPSPGREAAPVVGGRRAVVEAIRSGRASRVLMVAGLHATEGMRELLEEARRSNVAIKTTDEESLLALRVSDHQGVAAVVSPPKELDERDVYAASFGPDAVVVMLDGITDPQNFGASVRAAEAAGADMLIVRKRRSAPFSPAAIRASAGALFHLRVARVPNLIRTIEHLKERGFFVVGLDHQAPTSIHEAEPPSRPLVLVLGAEDVGLSRLVRESCDLLIAIPMVGRTGSLNAAAALAVGLFGYAIRPG